MGNAVLDDDPAGEIPPGLFDLDELRAQSVRDTLAFVATVPALLLAFVVFWIMLP